MMVYSSLQVKFAWGKQPAPNQERIFGFANYSFNTATALGDAVGYVCFESVKCDDLAWSSDTEASDSCS